MSGHNIYKTAYRFLILVLICLVIGILYNAYPLLQSYLDTKQEQDTYIIGTIDAPLKAADIYTSDTIDDEVQPDVPIFNTEKYPFMSDFTPLVIDHDSLKKENSDYIGWIEIPGTILSYPVFYSSDNDNYMHFDALTHKYKYAGSIFADMNYDESCRNVNIYGHNMKVGTMFSSLNRYGNKSYYETHPYFVFYPYGTDEYEIYQIFTCFVIPGDDPNKIINQFHFSSDEEFDNFVQTNSKRSIYNTGVDVSTIPDKIMTLCTCHGQHANDQRFVVEGKLLTDAIY